MGNIPSNEYWGNRLPRLINYGKHGRLNLRSVKLYADGMILLLKRSIILLFGAPCSGALGSWGAALLAPYSDKPDSHGLMLNSPEILETLVRQFWKDGWQTVRRMVLLVEHRLIIITYDLISVNSLHRGQSKPSHFGYLPRHPHTERRKCVGMASPHRTCSNILT